jgi:hypothetical protein
MTWGETYQFIPQSHLEPEGAKISNLELHYMTPSRWGARSGDGPEGHKKRMDNV